jgi:hypothetical protein
MDFFVPDENARQNLVILGNGSVTLVRERISRRRRRTHPRPSLERGGPLDAAFNGKGAAQTSDRKLAVLAHSTASSSEKNDQLRTPSSCTHVSVTEPLD